MEILSHTEDYMSVKGQGHKINSRQRAVTRTSGLGNMLISRYDNKP